MENLLDTASEPRCFEVVVKIDTEDAAMQRAVAQIKSELEVNLTVVVSPRPPSYFHTYIAFNEILKASDSGYYFCWHINDEILIETKGWDRILARYVGYFPDHIFRLKVNPQKMYWNFFDIHEIGLYADFPIVPRRWLDATGIWAPCHGPDTYQEAVSIHLARLGIHRNVPLAEIVVGGDEAGQNISPERTLFRSQVTCLSWYKGLTASMQEEMARAARRLQLFIMAHQLGIEHYELRDDPVTKALTLVAGEKVHARVSYAVDYVGLSWQH